MVCRYLTRLPGPIRLCEDLRIRHGQVVAKLTQDDMIALAAYLGSLEHNGLVDSISGVRPAFRPWESVWRKCPTDDCIGKVGPTVAVNSCE
jgi:hypothetical protein